MPKIIDNIEDKILTEAKLQMLSEGGYDSMTIRSVAKSCGIAVGTFYNYFSSKEKLAAYVMLDDWNKLTEDTRKSLKDSGPEEGIHKIFNMIRQFSSIYEIVWKQSNTVTKKPAVVSGDYHGMIVREIEDLIKIVIDKPDDPYLITFLAEILINLASNGYTEYKQIKPMINKLIY
ncbi:MAG: TetR/AcrR family transcriptional regulator [Clostridiales bacterium]|nr:TetR/AcrR family transcriptional regulator [Clostridiales bacterium]